MGMVVSAVDQAFSPFPKATSSKDTLCRETLRDSASMCGQETRSMLEIGRMVKCMVKDDSTIITVISSMECFTKERSTGKEHTNGQKTTPIMTGNGTITFRME